MKLNLINKKISDFLKIDINALTCIFISAITVFVIAGTFINHGDELKEKYKSHFPTAQIDSAQNPAEEIRRQKIRTKAGNLLVFWIFMGFVGIWLLIIKIPAD